MIQDGFAGRLHFLSAFAAAARSVTWVMKAEYLRVPGWGAWYAAQSPDADEKELLGAFTKLRNKSQKRDPLETKPVVIMDFPPESLTPEFKEMLERGVGKGLQVTVYAVPEDGDTSQIPSTAVLGVVRSAERRLDELGEVDVLDACEKYSVGWSALLLVARRGLQPSRSFDTDARRRTFASLRSSPPVAGQLRR